MAKTRRKLPRRLAQVFCALGVIVLMVVLAAAGLALSGGPLPIKWPGNTANGDSTRPHTPVQSTSIPAQRPEWRTITALLGPDDSPHPDVSNKVQDQISWCGKKPLANTLENRSKGTVWLTFDGGATADQLERVLANLKKYKVRGRFFFGSTWAKENSALMQKVTAGGHMVGNYADGQTPLLNVQAVDRAKNQWKVQDLPEDAIRRQLANGVLSSMVRFPADAYDERVLRITSTVPGPNGKTMQPCGWTVNSGDADTVRGPRTVDDELHNIQLGISPNAVILMHAGRSLTAGTATASGVLPKLIEWLKAQGYRLETTP